MTDLKKLREIAEAATPGPWECEKGVHGSAVRVQSGYITGVVGNKIGIYIATFNPKTALAILDRLEAAERALEYYSEFYTGAVTEYDRPSEHRAREALAEIRKPIDA